MLSSLLGLRHPFHCIREYSVANFLSIFGFTKVGSDQVLPFRIKQPSRFEGTGRHFESVQVVGHIPAFVPPPAYTDTMA